jgi:ABC-type nitrate/sulfonate/bicarbonate transport system substrate-binding protein
MRTLRIGTFSPSVVLGVAAATGALDAVGLAIIQVPASSSPQQFSALLAGELDAVITSPDNVLAYRFVADNPLGRTCDLRILAAVDRGLGLSLFAAPGVEDLDSLRGGVLAVDVPTSGFAFVAYELLARRGIKAGIDCEVTALGSTPRRAEALAEGRCAATVLNAGNDLRAEEAGCHRLSRAKEIGPYVATVLASTAEREEKEWLPALVRVIVDTSSRLASGHLHEHASSVTARLLKLSDGDVRRYVELLADPEEGLVPGGRVDRESLETLVRLRMRHHAGSAGLADSLRDDTGLLDERFLPGAAP